MKILLVVCCVANENKMKKTLALFLVLLCTISAFAQEGTLIKGKIINAAFEEIKLFKTVDGNMKSIATAQPSSDGSYGFWVVPEKAGFYALGNERMNFIIYLKGGEEVNVDLEKTKAVLNGKNSKENKTLYLWNDYAENIRLKSVCFLYRHSNYKDFFPDFEKFLSGLPALKKKLRSGNAEFDQKLQNLIESETDYFAVTFLMTPRTVHPKKSDWPAFYSNIISKDKFITDEVLEYPHGVRMLYVYTSFGMMNSDARPKGSEITEHALSLLHTPRLKGEYLMNSRFRNCRSYDQYLAAMKDYGQYLVTPSLKERAEAVGTKLYETRSGAQAADFTYPDVDGKEVSLSDFKGKVVLVDVWATWCGPCKREIPHLIQLEKEMKGRDLVVLGVSVDEAKNKQKWLDFIKEKGLGGVQVLADGWSKITKDYKITGIPRFMVFDKKGNVVSVDAPRPSDPALRKLLEEELKK